MGMWSAQDIARESVRRRARGLSADEVAGKVADAARRAQRTRQQRSSPGGRGPYESDPEHLAQVWAAKHTEWRRIAALLAASGQQTYDPEHDVQGTAWARERSARKEAALARRTAWERERQDARNQMRLQVWLSEDVGRRLAATRLTPEQVLAHLARHAELHTDGTLTVPPVHPR
ncbi:hypothetical protein ACFOOM_23005 [Streptomyces echinoruber]|uniref:Uncharacterized protein n=1 Tax=Streptomyces echinoruber TaxID=68898 RepID=A0A918RDA5_9ACTN|nr:hypothetical protein [Streptomyces echinoruber]GGZ92507.1 hypothetical protein GCM10010389_33970 [Streptomyces echinoruber]